MCIPWYRLVQLRINKIFQNSAHRRSGREMFYDTSGYTYHWTVILVILVSLACTVSAVVWLDTCQKQFRINNIPLRTKWPYILFSCILIFFRLYFGSVETLKYKPTKSVPRSRHVFLEAFGGPVQSFSVLCIPTGGTHITSDMCAGIHISRGTHITATPVAFQILWFVLGPLSLRLLSLAWSATVTKIYFIFFPP